MAPHLIKPEITTQRIVLALVGTSLLAIATVVGIAFWMSAGTNITAAEKSQKIVNNALTASLGNLATTISSFAFWQDIHGVFGHQADGDGHGHGSGHDQGAHLHPAQHDTAGLRHLSKTFDAVYMVYPDETTIVDLRQPTPEVAQAVLGDATLTLLQNKRHNPDDQERRTITGFVTMPDGPAAVAVSWMSSEEAESVSLHGAEAHLMVGIQYLDDTFLAQLGGQYLIIDLRLADASAPVPETHASLQLSDISGAPVALLQWQQPRPGDDLFRRAIPIMLAMAGMLLAVSLLVGRSTAAQTAAFLHEHAFARTDRLTGLTNRAGLDDILSAAPVNVDLSRGAAAAIYIDLNGFKALNDTLGHDAGDRALQITAKRILAAVREVDIVARLGGDEFVCVLIDDAPRTTAIQVADRIRESTDHPIHLRGEDYFVRASQGISLAQPGQSWERLLHHADIAMYHAKVSGETEPVFFIHGMDSEEVIAARATRAA